MNLMQHFNTENQINTGFLEHKHFDIRFVTVISFSNSNSKELERTNVKSERSKKQMDGHNIWKLESYVKRTMLNLRGAINTFPYKDYS
jgi:hypothetical protein